MSELHKVTFEAVNFHLPRVSEKQSLRSPNLSANQSNYIILSGNRLGPTNQITLF